MGFFYAHKYLKDSTVIFNEKHLCLFERFLAMILQILLTILIYALIFSLVWYILGFIGLPEPIGKVVRVVILIIGLIVLVGLLTGQIGVFPVLGIK